MLRCGRNKQAELESTNTDTSTYSRSCPRPKASRYRSMPGVPCSLMKSGGRRSAVHTAQEHKRRRSKINTSRAHLQLNVSRGHHSKRDAPFCGNAGREELHVHLGHTFQVVSPKLPTLVARKTHCDPYALGAKTRRPSRLYPPKLWCTYKICGATSKIENRYFFLLLIV